MGTWFETWLIGDDPAHLDAVAVAALEEIRRLEGVLSRHDPRAELARVNREAAGRAVLASVELFELLGACRAYRAATAGRFDPAAASGIGTFDDVALDEARRTVRFHRPGLTLDLGGIGKGYALDHAAEVLAAYGVTNALLHGGTSSALAIGGGPDGDGWPVGVRDPAGGPGEAARLRLRDRGFSCSGVFGQNQGRSDVIDPIAGRPLGEPGLCAVAAPTATAAEAYSTALLVAGRAEARRLSDRLPAGFAVGWADRDGDGTTRWAFWPAPGEPR